MGTYKCNKNGIREKHRHIKSHLKMIKRIRRTSKKIFKDGRSKFLYTFQTDKGVTLFRYAYSDEEAKQKFRSALGLPVEQPKLKTKYPSLDILLNKEFILIN